MRPLAYGRGYTRGDINILSTWKPKLCIFIIDDRRKILLKNNRAQSSISQNARDKSLYNSKILPKIRRQRTTRLVHNEIFFRAVGSGKRSGSYPHLFHAGLRPSAFVNLANRHILSREKFSKLIKKALDFSIIIK